MSLFKITKLNNRRYSIYHLSVGEELQKKYIRKVIELSKCYSELKSHYDFNGILKTRANLPNLEEANLYKLDSIELLDFKHLFDFNNDTDCTGYYVKVAYYGSLGSGYYKIDTNLVKVKCIIDPTNKDEFDLVYDSYKYLPEDRFTNDKVVKMLNNYDFK